MNRDTLDSVLTSCKEKRKDAIFILNLVLLLEGERECFIASLKYMERYNSIIPNNVVVLDNFITLDSNVKCIRDVLDYEEDLYVATGKVLGYRYNGTDWRGRNRDTYSIVFSAYRTGLRVPLYCFNVPVEQYSREISELSVGDADRFNECLSKYGFNVELRCFLSKPGKPLIRVTL